MSDRFTLNTAMVDVAAGAISAELQAAILAADIAWECWSSVRSGAYFTRSTTPYVYGNAQPASAQAPSPAPLPAALALLWSDVERRLGMPFEAMFLSLYRDGRDHIGWHSDASPSLDHGRPIVIASFGAPREMQFRRVGHHDVECAVTLVPGSLLIMPPGMQRCYQHRIPPAPSAGLRISATFRGITAIGEVTAATVAADVLRPLRAVQVPKASTETAAPIAPADSARADPDRAGSASAPSDPAVSRRAAPRSSPTA